MKRTRHIELDSMRKAHRQPKITAVSLAVASAMAASGCSESTQEARIFQSLEDCKKDFPDAVAQCEAAYQHAITEASRTAPKYSSRNDCESEFGYANCVQAPGSNWFMPAMAGFMFAQLLDRNRGYQYQSSPMFISTHPSSSYRNRWIDADGAQYGDRSQRRVHVGNSAFKPKPATTRTISRGGFGSMASAKSSWGGGSRGS
jgi:uncharacterized protein YgiB involved in biofilm formation